MNNSEIFLLGLVNQSPKYGYEIAQFLTETNANLWINISMPYVYRLLKNFEERGWVSAEIVESKNRPNRNCYQITDEGRNSLIHGLTSGELLDDKIYFSSDVALAVSAITNIDFNILQIITGQIKQVKEEIERFDLNTWEESETSEVKMARLIIEHRVIFLRSQLEWLEKVKATIDTGH